MSDNEISDRLWVFLIRKYLEAPNWGRVLESLGCRLFYYFDLHEDTPEYIFVRDTAMGNIGVPRDVAIKILALGQIP